MQNSDLRAIFLHDVRKLLAEHPDRERYGYLQGDRFEPHEWVLDSMKLAYDKGVRNADYQGVF